jgi:plastocyanin
MVRFRLLQRYLAAPMGGLLLLAAVAGCSTNDDDDDDADSTIVTAGSVTPGAGTAAPGSSATPAAGTPATAAGVATGTSVSDDDDDDDDDDEDDQVLRVSISDEAIEPSSLTASPGQITFEITNNGTTPHNLALDIDDQPTISPDVAPGETETWTINLQTTGSHPLYSLRDGEKEGGLEATLTIAE